MIYQAHIAGALALLALVAGTYLLTRVCHQEVCCRGFAKVVAIFVIVLSLLILVCNAYHSFRFWKMGADRMPGMGMHGARMMEQLGPEHMQKMMKMMERGEGEKPQAK